MGLAARCPTASISGSTAPQGNSIGSSCDGKSGPRVTDEDQDRLMMPSGVVLEERDQSVIAAASIAPAREAHAPKNAARDRDRPETVPLRVTVMAPAVTMGICRGHPRDQMGLDRASCAPRLRGG